MSPAQLGPPPGAALTDGLLLGGDQHPERQRRQHTGSRCKGPDRRRLPSGALRLTSVRPPALCSASPPRLPEPNPTRPPRPPAKLLSPVPSDT